MLEIHRLRAAFKYGLAAAFAGVYAVSRGDILFIWYPILAVVMCMDETDTRVMAASRARLLGTITAGIVSFLIHTMLSGWIGLTVALLIVVPLLRLLGWQSSLAIAVLVCSMLFLVADYAAMDWVYAFNRTVDTLVGVVATLVVSFLLWPVNRMAEIRRLDSQLRSTMSARLVAIRQWLKDRESSCLDAPQPIVGARLVETLRQLVGDELRSSPRGLGHLQHWRQRSLLWDRINHHSLQLQRLGLQLPQGSLAEASTPWIEGLPEMLMVNGQQQVPALVKRQSLELLAERLRIPPLLLLAIDDELQRLVKSIHSLSLASCRDGLSP
jgi:uncharacterized membrane protein YccC